MLFINFDAIGACVDIGLPIGAGCSKESFDASVAARLSNELLGLQRELSDGVAKIWNCPPVVELERVIEGCPCCTCVFDVLLLAFEKP